ncbi:DUF1694 domain-containing protein [Vagococcus fluvialis]|uniref:DUF1694 domain-containing protein n=1 Tax=Vagococcus fluvialis TaxID=2738 RepID=UPI00378D7AB0
MTQKDIQDYLDKGMYGAPQIKPDEVKKYLGTFRERVVFSMTCEEAEGSSHDSFCLDRFKQYVDGTLSINANSPLEIQNHYMKLAQQVGVNFKMVDTELETVEPDDITIVFSVDYAINLEDISVKDIIKKKKQAVSSKPTDETPKKESLFKRLFKS